MFAGNAHTHLADLFHLVMETLYSLTACSIHGVRGTNLVSGYLPLGSLTLPNSASPSSPKCSLQLQVIIAASVKTMLYDSKQESLRESPEQFSSFGLTNLFWIIVAPYYILKPQDLIHKGSVRSSHVIISSTQL
jgi:hypothetical protein